MLNIDFLKNFWYNKNMKDKRNRNRKEYIARKAKKIAEIEKQMRLGKDVQTAQKEIQDIMCTLSIEDMLEIDEYIIKNNLLKSS